jgi:hypothetical protein
VAGDHFFHFGKPFLNRGDKRELVPAAVEVVVRMLDLEINVALQEVR